MTSLVKLWTLLLIGVFASRQALSQDLLLQPADDELLIGPIPFEQIVQGVRLSGRASLFFQVEPIGNNLQMNIRGVADLADLQGRIGAIIDTISLPNDNCSLVATIWGKRVTVEGNQAILELNGDVDAFVCLPVFDPLHIKQPFDILLPLSLKVVGSQSLALELGEPRVQLGGPLAGVTNGILVIAGVNLNDQVKALLERAIDPKILRQDLPKDLAALNPNFKRAEFVSNSGALAASVEMSLSFESEGIAKLVEVLLSRPQKENARPLD